MFLELTTAYHSDINMKFELVQDANKSEPFETSGTYPKTKYKVIVMNQGETLYSKGKDDNTSFIFKRGAKFDLHVTQALYDKLKNYVEGEIILIRFVTKIVENHFWKVELTDPDPIDINEPEINEDYEKKRIQNNIKSHSELATTDQRIAWAVGVNNATRLIGALAVHYNWTLEECTEKIKQTTPKIYATTQDLEPYLKNQTKEETNNAEPAELFE